MTGVRCHCLFWFLGLLSAGQTGAVAWDEAQLNMLQQYPPGLRWDNLQSAPGWAGGIAPCYNHKLGYHVFRLLPGQDTLLQLPAAVLLRLVVTNPTPKPDDLEIWVSNGSGLYLQTTPAPTSDSLGWIVPLSEPALVRIARPQHHTTGFDFGAFCSRQDQQPSLVPHRRVLPYANEPVSIRRDDQLQGVEFWHLPAREPVTLEVRGLTQIRIRMLVPWPAHQANNAQAFQIKTILDERLTNQVDCLAEAEVRHRLWINREPARLAREEEVYLPIPSGEHQLALESSLPLWLRLEAQDLPDYLFPRLNEPKTNAAHILEGLTAATDLKEPDPDHAISWATLAQAARSLARNNHPRDASGQAVDWVNRLALLRSDYPRARAQASALRNHHTFYRELLPWFKNSDNPIVQGSHLLHRLADPFVPRKPFFVASPVLEEAEDLPLTSHFVRVPSFRDPPLLYSLPQRSFESDLLISAVSESLAPIEFVIQFDELAPVRMGRFPNHEVPVGAFDPPLAAAVMAVRASLGYSSNSTALGSFFPLAPLLPAKDLRMDLPQAVRQIKIWQNNSSTNPLLVSARYRAAKPFLNDETAYRSLLQNERVRNSQTNLFFERWRAFNRANSRSTEPADPFINEWISLLRLMRASQREFAKWLDDASWPGSSETERSLTVVECRDLKDRVNQMEENATWQQALETWNTIFWRGPLQFNDESHQGIIRCLRRIGEPFLMEQYLRWLALHGIDPAAREFAWRELESLYSLRRDLISVEAVRMGAALECPCPRHFESLVCALEANQRHEMALWLGLCLPRTPQLAEVLLHSSLHMRWWTTFDELVDELADASLKALWRARKAITQNQPAQARLILGQTHALNDDLLQYLAEAQQIARDLASPALQVRASAILAWEDWQRRAPGPRWWIPAPELIWDFAGASLVYNPERDTYAQHYRATRSGPLVLRFLGPLRVQIHVRPILAESEPIPVDDDLCVNVGLLTNRFSICQIGHSQNLQVVQNSPQLLGVQSIRELVFGPGLHLVHVALDRHDSLIQVYAERPEFPVKLLPAFAPSQIEEAIRGSYKPETNLVQIPVERFGSFWRIDADAVDCYTASKWSIPWRSVGDGFFTKPAGMGLSTHQDLRALLDELPGDLALRISLRLDPGSIEATNPAGTPSFLPMDELGFWMVRENRLQAICDGELRGPEPLLEAAAMALGLRRQFLSLPEGMSSEAVLRRLELLLQVAEQDSGLRVSAQIIAEHLFLSSGSPPEAQDIMGRLVSDREWELLPVTPLSAGIHPVEVPLDTSESPALRVRRALLPPAQTNEYTLAGQEACQIILKNLRPTVLQWHFRSLRCAGLPIQAVRIKMQLDDEAPLTHNLNGTVSGLVAEMAAPEGTHRVRVWVEDPVVNQFLRVSWTESQGSTASTLNRSIEPKTEKRFYHVATLDEPVAFDFQGPGLFRIDEWRSGGTQSRFLLATNGHQRIRLVPPTNQAEAYYRIFQRVTRTNQVLVRRDSPQRALEHVASPRLALLPLSFPTRYKIRDYFSLGGQEDGSWAVGLEASRRRPVETSGEETANEFIQADSFYRRRFLDERMVSRTHMLARWHRPGDFTLGVEETLFSDLRWPGFDWAWNGSFVGGQLSQGRDDHDPDRWEAAIASDITLRQNRLLSLKSRHQPMIRLFGRYMTLEASTARNYAYLDHDLFTLYRSEHRAGLVLGDLLSYQPWLDTELQAGLYLTSNEGLNPVDPDHWSLKLAWQQRLGRIVLQGGYALSHFLDDADRSSDLFRHVASLNLSWEHWVRGRHRWETGLDARYFWPDQEASCSFYLAWHFSNGRVYRDFNTSETQFRGLRQRDYPASFNNFCPADLTSGLLP